MSKPFAHPLSGANLATLASLVARNGWPSPEHRLRFLAAAGSALGRLPATLAERAYTAARFALAPVQPEPVFVVGHWRSGTTHLGNVLAQTQRFGYIAPIAAGLPWELLTIARAFRPVLERSVPSDRLIDRVPVTHDSPQEDLFPLANMQTVAFLHALYFPRRFDANLRRGVFFDGCSAGEIARWAWAHQHYIRKLHLYCGQKPVLIRNPVYTARMRRLAELWPKARFIHIHRDPRRVFVSMQRYYRVLFPALALQPFEHVDVDAAILATYRRMVNSYLDDLPALDPARVYEIRYDDLVQAPQATLGALYHHFAWPEFDADWARIAAYLAALGTFQKNELAFDPAIAERVASEMARAMETWGYATTAPGDRLWDAL